MREDLLPKPPGGKLLHLIQECAEVQVECALVQKAVTKLMMLNRYAKDDITGIEYDNVKNLMREIDDLEGAIARIKLILTEL